MRFHLAAGLCICLVLGGCSSLPNLSDLLSFPGDEQDAAPVRTVASAAPAPAAAAPGAPDPFCLSVAAQNAQQGGFDQATQQRMVQRDYQQCVTLFRTQ
jgi:hypothetical protein